MLTHRSKYSNSAHIFCALVETTHWVAYNYSSANDAVDARAAARARGRATEGAREGRARRCDETKSTRGVSAGAADQRPGAAAICSVANPRGASLSADRQCSQHIHSCCGGFKKNVQQACRAATHHPRVAPLEQYCTTRLRVSWMLRRSSCGATR